MRGGERERDSRGAFKVMAFQWRCYKFICHNLLYVALLAYLYMPQRPHTGERAAISPVQSAVLLAALLQPPASSPGASSARAPLPVPAAEG